MEETTNPRFQQITPNVLLETLAPRFTVRWNPVDDTGKVEFECEQFLSVDGVYHSSTLPKNSGVLYADLQDLIARQFVPTGVVDPVTGAELSSVSGAGMMLIVKHCFDALYRENAERVAMLNSAAMGGSA